MTSKADKLPLETEPVAHDNTTILTLKPGDQTLSRLTQLIIVVKKYGVFIRNFETNPKTAHLSCHTTTSFPGPFRWLGNEIGHTKHPSLGGGGGRVLPEKLGGGIWPTFQIPYPVYDSCRNLAHSLANFY